MRGARAALAGLALVTAACGGGGDGDEGAASTLATTPGDEVTGSSSTTVDATPFCQHVRALEALGDDAETTDPTPEEVVAQSEVMLDVLGEITVNVPQEAPPAVEQLIDDYRAIAEAVGAAAGDVDAAFEAIQSEDAGLFARISDADAHRDAFVFFNERCGTPIP